MTNSSIDLQRLHAIEENYKSLKERAFQAAVKSGRKESDVRFMAVTKTVESAYINHAISLGVDLIGENRVQEFLSKKDELNLENCEKHLIGHLQTNKVKQIVTEVDMIQSVGSVKLAKEISKQCVKNGIVMPSLIEVNIGNEESKSGFSVDELQESIYEIAEMPGICVKGLMAIPPICENSKEVRKFFSNMYKTFIDISSKKLDNISMSILSMGMSGDFEEAIMEGSTLIRVGSALFGARQYR